MPEINYKDKNNKIIDYYTLFNVTPEANSDEIKQAFRNLIKKYHPDSSKTYTAKNTEQINIIVQGYKILTDEDIRRTYDRELFQQNSFYNKSKIIISKRRILYSGSLKNMLKANMHPKNTKRKDIISSFGQDIEILITQYEALKGAMAYLDLPARMTCPVCNSEDQHCNACKGIGRINTTSQLEIKIPPHVDDSTFIDVDLLKMRPDASTNYTVKHLRIKITITR